MNRFLEELRPNPDFDTSYLDKLLLDEKKQLIPIDSSILKYIPHLHLQIFCHKNGIYHIITTELIEFLKNEIGSRRTIEINAGNGCISRTLGITGIDNRMHTRNKRLKERLLLVNGSAPNIPKEIKNFEALNAVRLFRPEIVVGAFVTQKSQAHHSAMGIQGSFWGVDETAMLKMVKKYIHFGNKETHRGKFIFSLAHQELSFHWLYNRSRDQSLNRVWIWGN